MLSSWRVHFGIPGADTAAPLACGPRYLPWQVRDRRAWALLCMARGRGTARVPRGSSGRRGDAVVRALTLLVLHGAAAARGAPFEHAWTAGPPVAARDDFCGAALALGDDVVVAGVPYRDVEGEPDAGAVVLFAADSGAVRGVVTAPRPARGARFGSAVAMAGGTLAVGAPDEEDGRPHSGAGYRFDRRGVFAARLANPQPGFDDLFGAALAVTGRRLVLGAPLDDVAVPAAGAAWLQDLDTGASRPLTKPTPVAYDRFGNTVAATDEHLVVGAPGDDLAGPNGGAVYVFEAARGRLLHTLRPPSPAGGDEAGQALAAAGTLLVVGVPGDDIAGETDAGAVLLFDLVGGAMLRRCTAPMPENGARFGAAVAIQGESLVVGAPREDREAVDAGAVYVLDADCGLLARIANPAPHPGDQFGHAVSAATGRIAVGAWHDDATGTAPQSGAVHVFVDRGAPPATTTTTTTTTTTSTAGVSSTTGAVVTTTTVTPDPDPLPVGETTTTAPAGTSSTAASVTTSTGIVPPTTAPSPEDPCAPVGCEPCSPGACEAACGQLSARAWAVLECRIGRLAVAFERHGPAALGPRRAARAGGLLQRARVRLERARRGDGARRVRLVRRAGRTLARLRRAVAGALARRAEPSPAAAELLTLVRAVEAAHADLAP